MGRAIVLITACIFFAVNSPAQLQPLQGIGRHIQASLIEGRTYENFLCQNCVLRGASLKKTVLKTGTCRYCDFSEVTATDFDARGVTFDHANFHLAILNNADLSAVRAYFSNFLSADLRNAKLWGADLRYCDFEKSDLRGADLLNALVIGAKFSGAKFNDASKLPFSKEQALSKGMVWEK